MSKTQADAAKEAMNRKLDKQAQDMVAQGKGTSDPNGLPTVVLDIRDKPIEPETLRKAHGLERRDGFWCVATVFYDLNDQIVKIERTQPNMKAIVLDELRMKNSRHWMELG